MVNVLSVSVNQTDRIQGMAAYMNSDGANIEWLSLAVIAMGAFGVWMLLKWLSSLQTSKQPTKPKARGKA